MSSLFSNFKFVRLPSRPTSRSNSPQPSSAPSTSSSLSWDQLFADAVEEYKKRTGNELPIHTQLTDLSAENIINVLEKQVCSFDKVRRGGAKVELMRKLAPIVDVVLSVNDVLGKAVALPCPPAAAIFSAVGMLLQGTKNVSQSYDALVNLCDCLRSFLERVRVYLDCSPKSTVNMKGVLVKMLAATLSVLAIATKEINKGRLRKYGEALLGDTSIQDALQRLDRITGEEARMVAVQGLEVFTDPLNKSTLKLFPLSSYAAKFWIHHVQETNIEPLLDTNLQFLEYRHEPYINWIRMYDVDKRFNATDFSHTRISVAHPAYYVALAGLHMVLEKLIGEGTDVIAQGGEYGSALRAASSGGHVVVVQLLLGKGANLPVDK